MDDFIRLSSNGDNTYTDNDKPTSSGSRFQKNIASTTLLDSALTTAFVSICTIFFFAEVLELLAPVVLRLPEAMGCSAASRSSSNQHVATCRKPFATNDYTA